MIVVLGISVSFSLDGWRQDRIISAQHQSEIRSLLEDLEQDRERLAMVSERIADGERNTRRILDDVLAYRSQKISYQELSATVEEVGLPYEYITFFMNASTYKSLVSTGRLQLFPEEINRKLRDYYEFVSKRVEDNNGLVDRITLAYYDEHHPWVNYHYIFEPGEVTNPGSPHPFFLDDQIREQYTDVTFLNSTMALLARILIHRMQVDDYEVLRSDLERALSRL